MLVDVYRIRWQEELGPSYDPVSVQRNRAGNLNYATAHTRKILLLMNAATEAVLRTRDDGLIAIFSVMNILRYA